MRLVDGRLVEMRAPRPVERRAQRPSLPRDKTAAPLDVVIAVMAFLAALALGASLVGEPHGG